MYLVKTPKIIKNLFPNFTWSIPSTEKEVFITFDDGPIPEVTPWVVEQLAAYQAKATFFCVGDNAEKHPEVLEMVSDAGHALGNHTFNHLNGWHTDNMPYFHNIRRCSRLVRSPLFRPPYGKLKPKQAQFLQRHYRIVMWDILSGDFDPAISKEQCLANVLNNVASGSIIVFHDSLKAESKLRYALPRVLDALGEEGYAFGTLSPKVAVNKQAVYA
jgi:peptidoglycan/xylan/chitin deacetylase (PgdA/CDA1 family)